MPVHVPADVHPPMSVRYRLRPIIRHPESNAAIGPANQCVLRLIVPARLPRTTRIMQYRTTAKISSPVSPPVTPPSGPPPTVPMLPIFPAVSAVILAASLAAATAFAVPWVPVGSPTRIMPASAVEDTAAAAKHRA